jgi:hypothetical protein
MRRTLRPATFSVAWALGVLAVSGVVVAAEPGGHRGLADAFKGQNPTPRSREGLREPILRVADNSGPVPGAVKPAGGEVSTPATPTSTTPTPTVPAVTEHPLEPVLKMAYRGLEEMNKNITDYTATLVKRERINGKLGEHQYAFVKIRNQPLSVYMYFLAPANIRGREVIYVAGQNLDRTTGKAKLVAHDVGLRGLITVDLDPESPLAMDGQRYPIYKIGIRNLTQELIEHGEKDKKFDECDVKFFKGAKVQDRTCTCLQAVHPHKRPHFRFHLARVYIDDEYQIPIRFESYTWPTQEGGAPVLDEEYTYMKLKLNAGLTDADFDRRNPNYKFR